MKTLLFIIGVLFLGAGCFVSLKFDSLLIGMYLVTIGEILAFPVMKDEYDNYQNGEDSGTGLVRFLGFFAATVIGILFCIVLTVFTIRDALGGSEGGRREKLGGRGAGSTFSIRMFAI